MNQAMQPFQLEPIFLDKVWGAAQMPPGLKDIFNPPPYTGEIWLASDRHHITKAKGGPFDGLGLDEIVGRWPGRTHRRQSVPVFSVAFEDPQRGPVAQRTGPPQ